MRERMLCCCSGIHAPLWLEWNALKKRRWKACVWDQLLCNGTRGKHWYTVIFAMFLWWLTCFAWFSLVCGSYTVTITWQGGNSPRWSVLGAHLQGLLCQGLHLKRDLYRPPEATLCSTLLFCSKRPEGRNDVIHITLGSLVLRWKDSLCLLVMS